MNKTRVERLRLLIDELGGRQSEVARLSGISPQQMSQYMSGNRGLGERVARKIEAGVGKPVGWLDDMHTNHQTEPAGLSFEDLLVALADAPGPMQEAIFAQIVAMAQSKNPSALMPALLALLGEKQKQRRQEIATPDPAPKVGPTAPTRALA